MKAVKIIDCVVQSIILLVGCSVMLQNGFKEYYLLYLMIGPWQLLSMFFHLVMKKYYRISEIRKVYLKLLVFTVVTWVMSAMFGDYVLRIWGTFLMMVSGLLAAMYFTASIIEANWMFTKPLKVEMKREQL